MELELEGRYPCLEQQQILLLNLIILHRRSLLCLGCLWGVHGICWCLKNWEIKTGATTSRVSLAEAHRASLYFFLMAAINLQSTGRFGGRGPLRSVGASTMSALRDTWLYLFG